MPSHEKNASKRIVFTSAAALLLTFTPAAEARRGGAINPDAVGVARYYDMLPTQGGAAWERQLNDALVKISCGDGASRSAHLVRGADGGVRVFTTWHSVANVVNRAGDALSRECRIKFGAQERTISACRLVDLQAGARENPERMYRRYYEHYIRGETAQMFSTPRSDWASLGLTCTDGAAMAMLSNAALPVLGHDARAIDVAISQTQARFVTVGALNQTYGAEPRVYSARIGVNEFGAFDRAQSAQYGACVYSNYAERGMSGGFLAAVLGAGTPNERVALICVITSEQPHAGQAEANAPLRNYGAFYPD